MQPTVIQATSGQSVIYGSPNTQIVTGNPQQYGNQQVIIQTAPQPQFVSDRRKMDHFYAKTVTCLGISQVVCGVLAIIFNIVIYVDKYHTHLSVLSHGTWCGIFFCVTGALGIASGIVKNKCLIVAFMVMCIVTAVIPAPNMLITAAIDLGLLVDDLHNYNTYSDYYNYYNYHGYYDPYNEPPNKVGVAMESLILILSLIGLFASIVASCFCCHGVCCCHRGGTIWNDRSVQYISTAPAQNGQQVVYMTGAPMYNQPAYPVQQMGYLPPPVPPQPQAAAPQQPLGPPLYTDQPAPQYQHPRPEGK